jgi:hypothetical protein
VGIEIAGVGDVAATVMRHVAPGAYGVVFSETAGLKAALVRKILGGGYSKSVDRMRAGRFVSVLVRRFAG